MDNPRRLTMAKKNKKSYSKTDSPFYKIKTKNKLAAVLKMDFDEIEKICLCPDQFYKVYDIEENGKIRRIEEPIDNLRKLHDRISYFLKSITPPDYLFCPVSGKSAVTNVNEHKDNPELLKLDITKYFPSTTFGRIYDFFKSEMQCAGDIAWYLSKLMTYDWHLPTGSPISPYLSYYAHEKMWENIHLICCDHDYKLTVYIDDAGISGKNISGAVVWEIKKKIKKYGLHYHKEQMYSESDAKLLTGAVIHNGKLKLRNKHHLKIKQTRMAITNSDNEDECNKLTQSLNGLLSYKKQIEKCNS